RFGSHEFLAVKECPISSPLINRVLARLIELEGCDCPDQMEEVEFFADANDEHLLASAFFSRGADEKKLSRWAQGLQRQIPAIAGITFFPSRRRMEKDPEPECKPTMHEGANAIQYRTAGAEYRVSAGAFF